MKKLIFQPSLIRAGILVWLFGCGPYLGLMGLDKLGIDVAGNPQSLALLMMIAAPLGFVLVVVGVAMNIFNRRDKKDNNLL